MAEESGQERTEQATPRRRQQAREKGQVARSRELSTVLVLLSAVTAGLFIGPMMASDLADLISDLLQISHQQIFQPSLMIIIFSDAILDALQILAPFFLVVVIASIAGPLSMGGINFSVQAMAFKWEKLDPIKGMQRIFAWRGLLELVKALAKFLLIACVAVMFLYWRFNDFLTLSDMPLFQAMTNAVNLLLWSLLAMIAVLVFIAAVDVPFQLWDHSQRLKMTRQEVKDDTKDTEGNPDVRSQVRRLQREMAQRRMMEEIPKADVVITNPEHYSVALRYEPTKIPAPIVVAKGVDQMALRIRLVAKQHAVMLLEAPALARALYYATDLNREIPAGLYLAVAQVLAYIYQLKRTPKVRQGKNNPIPDFPIPDDLRHDD